MSDTATPPAPVDAPALPLFYKRVVGVNPALHGSLRLERGSDYGYSAQAQSVPLGLGEFEAAAQHFPILFSSGPNPTPVALLGLGESNNSFVEPDGAWRADTYVPAYIRAFPFIFVEDGTTKSLYVGMEPDAACLRTDSGAALFEDGKPTPTLSEAISFCSAFRDNTAAAAALGRALQENGLLEEEEATINFTAGGTSRIRGFKIVRADRLDQLSDETFLDWRRRGWLPAIYAHLFSAGRWGRLIELAAVARSVAPQAG
jgi:SapC